jgi:hypothetical protein
MCTFVVRASFLPSSLRTYSLSPESGRHVLDSVALRGTSYDLPVYGQHTIETQGFVSGDAAHHF